MFGGKNKSDKSKKDRSGRNLAQYGLFDVSGSLDLNVENQEMNDDNDSDLEAELLALTGDSNPSHKKPKRRPQAVDNLDEMVAASMKDVPSDAELSDDDDDPDILNELNEIAGDEPVQDSPLRNENSTSDGGASDIVKLLEERSKMYEEAEKNAKAAGELGRARRFNRGLKTLKDMLKQVKNGKSINNEDIPPEVSVAPRKTADESSSEIFATEPAALNEEDPIPTINEDEPKPQPQIDQSLINMLNEKKSQFKMAALTAKKSGDNATALNYIKTVKQFEHVISAAESGQPVDLSRMPELPPQTPKVEEEAKQTGSIPVIPVPEGEIPEAALITASSIEEALQQRLEIYQKQEQASKDQGNASKARRMGRIVKQYEQAIKMHKAGKSIPVDDLPTPPGYAPIPVEGGAGPSAPVPNRVAPKPPSPPKPSTANSQTTRITGNHVPNSRAEKQLQLLLAKQKEFKIAALNAKKQGEMEQAKEYLKTAKGFEPLIEASTCGLPVDLSTIPLSPTAKSHLEEEFDIVTAEDYTGDDNGNKDILARLESQLNKQLKMCLTTRDHHKTLGDVGGTNRFERLALSVTKDLDLIRLAQKTSGVGIPKFHYEIKDFSIVKSFTDIGDNDLELTILRGISYTCTNPKDVDTYVKFEFPFPQEEPYVGKTNIIKNTNSPEYNQTFTIPIQRTSRACQRVFKRHSVKLEVYSKGGFFRSDTLIGTSNVKLQHLETQCELHDSFDLFEGRKKVGGKLEVRLRLRHPIVSQEIEQLHEKWLVIDT